MTRLAIEIGNSSFAVGWGKSDIEEERSFSTGKESKEPFLELLTEHVKDVSAVGLASVNPSFERRLTSWLRQETNHRIRRFRRDIPCTLDIDVEEPEAVGDDRLLNAEFALRTFGATTIVIDAGTAVTVDVVTSDGIFAGGMIAPGFPVMKQTLSERAAQLPEDLDEKPLDEIIGRSTESAMKSGLQIGFVGMVRQLIERTKRELDVEPRMIGTGGDISRLKDRISLEKEQEHFPLKGLFHAMAENE